MKKCLLIAGLSILVTLIAVACGGDNKKPQVITQSDLRDMVTLDSEGLPWKVSLRQEGPVSNDDAADQTFDPEQWRKDYETWGRITGHQADYDSEDQRIAVIVEIELYESDSGAAEAWAAAREFALSQPTSEGPQEMEADGIGEQSSVLRFEFASTQTDSYVVFFRRGSVLAQAGIGGMKGEISQEDALAVARLLDERIKSALER